jgi:hypothetical protein
MRPKPYALRLRLQIRTWSQRLYALVDVEVQVAGLSFVIVGVQVRRGSGGLSARLPTHRDVNGAWRPVVEMPEEPPGRSVTS